MGAALDYRRRRHGGWPHALGGMHAPVACGAGRRAGAPRTLAAELLVGHKDEPVWQPGHVLLHHHLGGGGDGGSEQHPAQHPRVQGRQVLPAVEGAASGGGWRAVAVAEGQRAVLLGGVGAATLRYQGPCLLGEGAAIGMWN